MGFSDKKMSGLLCGPQKSGRNNGVVVWRGSTVCLFKFEYTTKPWSFLGFFIALKCVCWYFQVLLQTKMTDFPILLYASTSEILPLHIPDAWKRYPFRANPLCTGRTLSGQYPILPIPGWYTWHGVLLLKKGTRNERGEQEIYRLRQNFPGILTREPAHRLGNWKMETKQGIGTGVINYRARTPKKY